MYANYFVDKLKTNSVNFALFALGVAVGLLAVLLIYKIATAVKKKSTPKIKKYLYVPQEEDQALIKARDDIKKLNTGVSPNEFISSAIMVLVELVDDISKEYTGSTRDVTLEVLDANGQKRFSLRLDTDFTLENAVVFVENVATLVETAALKITDKYAIALNPILKSLDLGNDFRSVTVKNALMFLKENTEKATKKLEKEEAKRKKKETREKRNLKNLFKHKKEIKENIKDGIKTVTEEEKQKSYVKILNSVIGTVFTSVLPDLADNVRKLYGDGYKS